MRILYYLLFIFCFFPFLNILRLDIDSQPNALILSIFIILVNYKIIINRLPVKLMYIIVVLLLATLLLIFSNFSFEVISSYLSYVSLVVVPLAVYIALIRTNGLSFNFFKKIILIWFLVAIIQKLIYPEFLSFLQFRSAGSGLMGRGVTSLAPEPTYYGSVITLFIVIYFFNNYNNRESKKWIYLLFFQIIILSISSTVLAVFGISGILFLFRKSLNFKLNFKKIVYGFVLFILFLIAFPLLNDLFIETRFFKIVTILYETPELVLIDESINERLNHAIFPIINFYDNFLLPMGYNQFQDYIILKSTNPSYAVFFENLNLDHYKKIMSGYGAVFFELGIIGLFVPYYVFSISKKMLNKQHLLFLFIVLNMLLFTAISFNNSLILFVFGNIMYLSNYNETFKTN